MFVSPAYIQSESGAVVIHNHKKNLVAHIITPSVTRIHSNIYKYTCLDTLRILAMYRFHMTERMMIPFSAWLVGHDHQHPYQSDNDSQERLLYVVTPEQSYMHNIIF